MSKIVGELNAEMMKKVIHDRRAKLFAEIVAKTGSKQSVIDRAMQEIESLREQVEKLTKERNAFQDQCIRLKNDRAIEKGQLAALAEQNEKMRKVLLRLACLGNGDQYGNSIGNCIAQEALSLPDLATPVLNRIRAEAMEEAAKIANEHEGVAWAVSAIRNRKAELEKTNG